jgi:hypothetical protein
VIKLLLDEHISPDVAKGLRRRNPKLVVWSMTEWEGGNFLGSEDATCLAEAASQALTLVTYDQRTISPLLKAWGEIGSRHAGVVFIDEKTISQANIGGLVRALQDLVGSTADWDWTDRVTFVRG